MGLQFKRGTDSDRLFITPDVGEPIYTTDTKKLYIGDGTTTGGLLVSGTIGDSGDVQFIINEIVDSAYVQARQQDLVRDSAFVTDIVTSPYIQAAQKHYIDSALADYRFMDSNEVVSLIDAAYINSLTEANIDSAALIAVVDSAYVQARQDYAYSSLTGTPTALSEFTNDTNYLDSITVQGVVDASYIQANQITYNTSDFTDSTYVSDQITAAIDALIDNAPGTLDTLNEIAAALNDDDSAYATLVGLINDQLDSAEVIALINSAYVQARQITYNTSDFTDSAFVTGLPVSTFTNDANYLDSTTVQGVINATYIQSNQTTYTNVSEFVNDANYLDSTTVQGVVDATYINSLTEANIDSAALIALVDSAYVQARQAPGTDSSAVISLITATVDSAYVQAIQADIYRDSAFVTGIVDSAYINARVSTVDSGQVLNIVDIAGYTKLDSANVLDIIPDGTYRGLRSFEFTADSGDTIFTGTDINGNTLSYNPGNVAVAINGILLRNTDYSVNAGTSITLTTAADSGDEISIFNVVAGGIDSTAALELVIDGTYRGLRTYTFTADSGDTAFTGLDDNGNTLTYSRQSLVVYVNGILLTDSVDYTALDGSTITLTNPADSADVITFHNIVAGGQVDSALVNQLLLANVDSAYVQARQLGYDQSLNTTDSVTFASIIVTGNLQVNGTTTTVNSEDLSVTDHMIYMNAGESAGSPTASIDVGWAANVNDDGSYAHVGMFRDATDNTFKVYEGYTPEPDAGAELNTAHASFSLAPFAARTLTGQYLGFDSDFATKTISDLTNDANYLDSTTVQGVINAAYIQANQTTYTVLDSADVANIIATYGYSTYDSANAAAQIEAYGYLTSAIDSAGVIALITANDQQRDSGFVTGIVDSAYIQARVAAGTDSATVAAIVEAYGYSTLDSAAALNLVVDGTYRGIRTYTFIADSGATAFSGVDKFGNTLTYSPQSIAVYANGILLVDSDDYSAPGGSTITLVDAADSGDIITIHNIVAGGTDSALINQQILSYIDSAYVNARVSTVDSAQVLTIVDVNGYTKYDSADTTGMLSNYATQSYVTTQINNLIDGAPGTLNTLNEIAAALNDDDSAYATLVTLIGTKSSYDSTNASAQIEAYGYLTDALDSAEAIALIATQGYLTDAIDSARITSMLASDSFSIGGTIIGDGKIEVKNATGSTPSFVDLYCEVNNAHYTRIQSEAHANYSGNVTLTTPTTSGTLALTSDIVDSAAIIALITANDQQRDSAFVTGIIDSAYVAARTTAGTDSATVISLITSTVDSAYVALREANAGVVGGGLDSAAIINLVDSAYVQARQTTVSGGSGGGLDSDAVLNLIGNGTRKALSTFEYIVDSGATSVSGVDQYGATLSYTIQGIIVYVNGILLRDSDYTATNGSSITFTDALAQNDEVTIHNIVGHGLDSSAVLNLIPDGTKQGLKTFTFTASLGDSTFSGADDNGRTLAYNGSSVVVYANGILLVNGTDYTATNGTSIRLTTAADSADVISVHNIVTAGIDSAATIGLIDSAYVAARVGDVGGGTDSATVLSLVQGLVDSAYVQARQSNTVGLIVDTYSYTADSAQTVFSGADNASNTLRYTAGDIQVFRNGILLVDSDDYTASNGTSITLTSAANTNDNLSVTAFSSADQVVQINQFEYTADSGATSFSGTDDFGNSLTYNVGNILVHLNGILLTDSADYTANNGTTITLITAADSADIVHISSFGTATALNKWRETAVSYTTEAGTKLIVDTSSGAVTVTLPASPVFGDEVKVIDGTGNAGTNNITINRNSNKILGADSDFTLDVNRAAVDLVYYNAAQGWIVSGNS